LRPRILILLHLPNPPALARQRFMLQVCLNYPNSVPVTNMLLALTMLYALTMPNLDALLALYTKRGKILRQQLIPALYKIDDISH